MPKNLLYITALMLFLSSFMGCSSTLVYTSKKDGALTAKKGTTAPKIATKNISGDRGKIVKVARSFSGTKYKFGGTTKSGIDCSGLIINSYEQGIGMNLPRVSNAQYKLARATSNPQPGDLVFFRISSWLKIDHVGIYTGNNNMIHASSKFGVVEVSLNNEYYQKRLVGFGSVIKWRKK